VRVSVRLCYGGCDGEYMIVPRTFGRFGCRDGSMVSRMDGDVF